MENTGFEPHASHTPPDASDTHTHARTAHIRALPPGRDPHDPPHNAPSLHQQHTAVHDGRARSVHNDPDLAVVIAAWPSLSADIQGQILALIQGQQRGEVQP